MRQLTVALVGLVLVFGSVAQGEAESILVYDNNTGNQRALDALDNLGFSYTRGYSGDFNTLLTGGTWDLVVVDCPSDVPGSPKWTPLINYVNGGGKAIMSFWDLNNDGGYGDPALPAAFDVSVTATFTSPQDVYRWDSAHPVFNAPNSLGDLTSWTDSWGDNGDKLALEALSGAVAIAGFTASDTAGQAAIVVGNSGRTLYNGFLFDDLNDPAGTKLIENEIMFIIPAPSTLVGLLSMGVMGLIIAWRRRKRAA